MTQLSNGTIVTDIDATHDNNTLIAQGYTIRHVETYHDHDTTCIRRVWEETLGEHEGAMDVDGKLQFPFPSSNLRGRLHGGHPGEGGIVDQDVYVAHLSYGPVHQLVKVRLTGDVALN